MHRDHTSSGLNKNTFATWKVFVPVVIGLCVVCWMLYDDAKEGNLESVWHDLHFSLRTWICLALAFLFLFGRIFGLSWRFRALTDRQLTWRQAFKVDLLCEFTSCITPSAVGGSSLGMIFLNSQGIEFGRATTLMMTTLFLDELFFVVFCPIIVWLTPAHEIFASGGASFSLGIRLTFWIIYAVIAGWTLLLFMGIIVKPNWVRHLLNKIFRWGILKKWQHSAEELGENMVATSRDLRNKPLRFWLVTFGATVVSWMSRFLVVNALFLGFLPQDDSFQAAIFARQFVIWVILMVSPTPGGSGLSEWLFSGYYGDLVPVAGIALILAIFWRIISYYVFLVIGALIVPGWLKSTYSRIQSHRTGDVLKEK